MPVWTSTRDPQHSATFAEAAARSLAPGGGLYVPRTIERLDAAALIGLSFVDRSVRVLQSLLDDVHPAAVERAVRSALDFEIPVVPVRPGVHALELFHGPTLAFKDVGARFLARILRELPTPGGAAPAVRTVLTATSGDTGAAVAHAFWKVPGFRVIVLYPKGRIAPLQERQFCTLGDNVQTYAVDGAFDDCQAMVKAAFDDADLRARHGLVSANSIHVARLVAQTTYYWEAAARVPDAVISVPSGNFGNLCAGLIAKRQGAPIRAFVAATNANATVPEYLAGADYRPRPSVITPANAMDVGAPNNFERIRWLYGDDRAAIVADVRSGVASNAQIADEMRACFTRFGYLCDPHGAVASAVLDRVLAPGSADAGSPGVFLATAHPAKFLEVVRDVLGFDPPLPPSLADRAALPVLSGSLAADPAALARVL